MWPVMVAAAVAGSGLIAKRLFSITNAEHHEQQDLSFDSSKHPLIPTSSNEPTTTDDSNSNNQSPVVTEESVFRFSSSGSRGRTGFRSRTKSGIGSRGTKTNVGRLKKGGVVDAQKLEKSSEFVVGGGGADVAVDQKKSGRRFSFCLKRRKTTKNATVKCGPYPSKDSSVFGWGLGVGIMCMMSAGKAEISKLNTSMDETAKVVQELKIELYKRKSSRNLQVSSSETNPKKIRGKHIQTALTKSSTENKDPNDINVLGLPVTDDGECASSVLTEEPEPQVVEMDQLEAELEFELQKLPWCAEESSGHRGIRSDVGETEVSAKGFYEPDGESSNSYQCHGGVLPSELNQKLCHLLIEQQEGQIVELESELHVAQSKLHEKEAELQALKDCVRRLTEFSLATAVDEETEAQVEQDWTSDRDNGTKIGPESNKSVVGMKRVMDYESSGGYVK